MKLYRTTKIAPSGHEHVRYSATKHQYAGVKGVLRGEFWYRGWKVRLEVAEIPDDAWVKVEEA